MIEGQLKKHRKELKKRIYKGFVMHCLKHYHAYKLYKLIGKKVQNQWVTDH
jgi:hypothetical protein